MEKFLLDLIKFIPLMNFQIRRTASSNGHHQADKKRARINSSKVSSSKKGYGQPIIFCSSDVSPNGYCSVEFSKKIKTKQTMQSLLSSSSGMQDLKLSTTTWCLYDSKKQKYIGFRENNQRQIASLTKIMTTILAIQFLDKYQLNPELYVKVTENASKMIGTTADLKARTWIKFRDLLYGAMLPSGNDAAYLISEVLGYLYKFCGRNLQYFRNLKFLDISKENTVLYTVDFVKLMNKKADEIGLRYTKFSNPHGLQNALNISCPKDIINLSNYASKNAYFRRIMNTVIHQYQFAELYYQQAPIIQTERIYIDKTNIRKEQKIRIHRCLWKNTNNLLHKGWQGIKTGQTDSAGSCLSSLRNGIYIVVLNCIDNEARFAETEKIYNWYVNKNRSQSTDDQDNNIKEFK